MKVRVVMKGTNIVHELLGAGSTYVRDGLYVVERWNGLIVERFPIVHISHISEDRSEDEVLHTFQSFPEGKTVQISGDPS